MIDEFLRVFSLTGEEKDLEERAAVQRGERGIRERDLAIGMH